MRLYISGSGVNANNGLYATQGAWDVVTGAVNKYLYPTKQGAYGTVSSIRPSGTTTNNLDNLLAKTRTDPFISNGTLSGNLQIVIPVGESNLDVNAFGHFEVWLASSTGSVKAVLVDDVITGTEWPIESSRAGYSYNFTLPTTSVDAGDVLVIEIGCQFRTAANLTARSGSMGYGGTGTDLVSGSTTVSNNPAWIENASLDGLMTITAKTATDESTFTEQPTSILMTDDATDNFNATDTATVNANTASTDLVSQNEQATLLASPSVTDSALLSESTQVLQILYANGVDNATQSEAVNIAASMLISETFSLDDTADILATSTSVDFATQTDSATINIPVTDIATQTEQTVQINQSLTDQAVLIEQILVCQPNIVDFAIQTESVVTDHFAQDSATLSESVVINVITSDTAKHTEISSLYASVSTFESYLFTDEVTKFKKTTLVFDDQITYPPATAKSRKPFRVLAQNIFTKEWVHNDLPLSDPALTYTVSGPNVFKSVLNTEIKNLLDLTPSLEPGATWLHAEEAGSIRQSTILLPFIDNTGEQKRQIEGEGFSSYLHQLYYSGPEWKKVQIDPADIIRYLWTHAQSKGNLGIIVSPNVKTPVRLGTQPKNVEFETGSGDNVSFEAGPYDLNFWEVSNLGTEAEKLYKETPIEFVERSEWNADKTDVIHYLDLGYPRIGRKRDDLIIREGENLKSLVPEYAEQQGNFPSSVIIIGAGEGPTAIRGYASQITGRIPYEVVLENEDITNQARADAIARFELNRRTKSRYSIKSIQIDTTHINTPWGSFMAGDDITVEGTIRYVGKIKDYERITEFTYSPRTRIADCSVSPSSSFSYGAIPEVDNQ